MIKTPIILLLCVASACAGAAAPDTVAPLTPPLKVAVFEQEPFVNASGDRCSGFAVDLWKAVAADLGRESQIVRLGSLPEVIDAVSSGRTDVGVGGIFVTEERLRKVDFSQPFLHGGLQVMVHEKRGSSLLKLWNGLRDSGHLKVFAVGLAVILLSTVLLTLAERRWNTEFHPDWPNGFAESFYHVMSVVMTGKSSHKGLPGPWGRILAGIWIACGVAVVAYITSSVTSVMTVNRLEGMIHGVEDLPGRSVGVIPGTVSAKYCTEHHFLTSPFPSLDEAVKALVNRKIDAVVQDAMTLEWYDNSHPELPITEVGPVFEKKPYAFVLPIASPLRHEINRSIIRQNESGFLETLRKQYFGTIQ